MPIEAITCQACRATWESPDPIDPAALERVALSARSGQTLDAMRLARSIFGLRLESAQALVRHLAASDRRCNLCNHPLTGGLVVPCSSCLSINYDFQGANPLCPALDDPTRRRVVPLRPTLQLGQETITEVHQLAFIRLIVLEWDALPRTSRGWGVWIVEHNDIPPDATEISRVPRSPRRSWFLTESSVSHRNINEFARFDATQMSRPWDQATMSHVPNPIFGLVHEIGLSFFARYAEEDDFYFDYVWGGRHGRGFRCRVNSDGQVQLRETLWIS